MVGFRSEHTQAAAWITFDAPADPAWRVLCFDTGRLAPYVTYIDAARQVPAREAMPAAYAKKLVESAQRGYLRVLNRHPDDRLPVADVSVAPIGRIVAILVLYAGPNPGHETLASVRFYVATRPECYDAALAAGGWSPHRAGDPAGLPEEFSPTPTPHFVATRVTAAPPDEVATGAPFRFSQNAVRAASAQQSGLHAIMSGEPEVAETSLRAALAAAGARAAAAVARAAAEEARASELGARFSTNDAHAVALAERRVADAERRTADAEARAAAGEAQLREAAAEHAARFNETVAKLGAASAAAGRVPELEAQLAARDAVAVVLRTAVLANMTGGLTAADIRAAGVETGLAARFDAAAAALTGQAPMDEQGMRFAFSDVSSAVQMATALARMHSPAVAQRPAASRFAVVPPRAENQQPATIAGGFCIDGSQLGF